MNFWDVFQKLCEDHGRAPIPVLRDLGMSTGNADRWKNGGGPTLKTAALIADYFGVPVDDLLVGEQSKEMK